MANLVWKKKDGEWAVFGLVADVVDGLVTVTRRDGSTSEERLVTFGPVVTGTYGDYEGQDCRYGCTTWTTVMHPNEAPGEGPFRTRAPAWSGLGESWSGWGFCLKSTYEYCDEPTMFNIFDSDYISTVTWREATEEEISHGEAKEAVLESKRAVVQLKRDANDKVRQQIKEILAAQEDCTDAHVPWSDVTWTQVLFCSEDQGAMSGWTLWQGSWDTVTVFRSRYGNRTQFHGPTAVVAQWRQDLINRDGITYEAAQEWLARSRGCIDTDFYEAVAAPLEKQKVSQTIPTAGPVPSWAENPEDIPGCPGLHTCTAQAGTGGFLRPCHMTCPF